MTVILVGIDFSPRSDRALRRAVLLARKFGHELLLVGVIEDDDHKGRLEARKGEAFAVLRQMERTLSDDDGILSWAEVRIGSPSMQLAKAAQDASADLMVVGPHRRGLIRDAFGAVTVERIVQQSKTPVLAANTLPSAQYRRLLFPVDFEDGSRQALDTFQNLNLAEGAEVVLLHIYDTEAREMLGRAGATRDMKREYLSERAEIAKQELKGFAASTGLELATLAVRETRGPIASDIEQFTVDDGTDLIIVSQSHKSLLGRSILGSVTKDLLRSGRVDVLMVPSE